MKFEIGFIISMILLSGIALADIPEAPIYAFTLNNTTSEYCNRADGVINATFTDSGKFGQGMNVTGREKGIWYDNVYLNLTDNEWTITFYMYWNVLPSYPTQVYGDMLNITDKSHYGNYFDISSRTQGLAFYPSGSLSGCSGLSGNPSARAGEWFMFSWRAKDLGNDKFNVSFCIQSDYYGQDCEKPTELSDFCFDHLPDVFIKFGYHPNMTFDLLRIYDTYLNDTELDWLWNNDNEHLFDCSDMGYEPPILDIIEPSEFRYTDRDIPIEINCSGEIMTDKIIYSVDNFATNITYTESTIYKALNETIFNLTVYCSDDSGNEVFDSILFEYRPITIAEGLDQLGTIVIFIGILMLIGIIIIKI